MHTTDRTTDFAETTEPTWSVKSVESVVRSGRGRLAIGHLVVASLLAPRAADVAAELRALPREVDVAEVRLDGFWPKVPDGESATDDLLTVLDAASVPLLATLRPRRQGGRFEGPEDVRLNLLAAAG
ncbi:MAG TPA: type I 3-dehydroquinate dehydratase, partial [Candidatus Thermoplasmatota archaeon]|nr:type I 3-dehydroquinate dehydratase [Candidatus Thermoplasmatota archaeon]